MHFQENDQLTAGVSLLCYLFIFLMQKKKPDILCNQSAIDNAVCSCRVSFSLQFLGTHRKMTDSVGHGESKIHL